jgi:hypothetical protein
MIVQCAVVVGPMPTVQRQLPRAFDGFARVEFGAVTNHASP